MFVGETSSVVRLCDCLVLVQISFNKLNDLLISAVYGGQIVIYIYNTLPRRHVKTLEVCNIIKTETLGQVFSCEFCEIFKNTFFYRTSLVAASETSLQTC